MLFGRDGGLGVGVAVVEELRAWVWMWFGRGGCGGVGVGVEEMRHSMRVHGCPAGYLLRGTLYMPTK